MIVLPARRNKCAKYARLFQSVIVTPKSSPPSSSRRNHSANNEFLVVWQGDDNSGSLVEGEEEIFGQRLNAATGAAVGNNDFRISDMGPNQDIDLRKRAVIARKQREL